MDPFVVDPHWHGLITAYFYLGGIAAGAYATYTLAGLFGDEDDHRAVKVAAYIAFPLVCVCGVLLIVDLGRPERFWHMMVQSETYRPMFKWWSPMSVGSWGLSAFGACSFASFVGVLAEDGWLGLGRWSETARRLRRGWAGRFLEVAGAGSAFFLGAYTGTLLSATNQPFWAQSTWLSALFLASSASTGVAAVLLLAMGFCRGSTPEVIERLDRLDLWAVVLELLMLAAFALSLGALAADALGTWPGLLVPVFVAPAGVVWPMVARRLPFWWARAASAVGVLAAGLALRYAVVGMPAGFTVGG
jgi:formate-dependent nitrite reductase membrane component NrfD